MIRDINYIRDKLLTLVAINILQPVKKPVLLENLENIDLKRLNQLLKELKNEKRINNENRYYRVTFKGLNSMLPGKGRMIRDLQRMDYLSKLSKKGGGI